jgi:hypothetical protein
MTPRSGCACTSTSARECHLSRGGEFAALEDEDWCGCRCHHERCRVCGAVGPLTAAGWCCECARWKHFPTASRR